MFINKSASFKYLQVMQELHKGLVLNHVQLSGYLNFELSVLRQNNFVAIASQITQYEVKVDKVGQKLVKIKVYKIALGNSSAEHKEDIYC